MRRLTARLLLIVLLAGSYAPLAVAFSATPPHACCLRKNSSSGNSRELSFDSWRHDQDCCRLLAVNQWAQPRPTVIPSRIEHEQTVIRVSGAHPRTFEQQSSHAVRAPPGSALV
jgi:hypothetical protein